MSGTERVEGETPLVSVIIPTRNRLSDLLVTLERVCADAYPRVEVFVYDDASDVDPREAVRARFPHVRIRRSETRVGPCELRNRMLAASRGEIVVGFDDDCSFVSTDAFAQIVETFERHPRLGLLSCRVRWTDGSYWPAHRGAPLRETSCFISCGFAARRAVLEAVGGFDSRIFRDGEERDLAIRLMDAGYEIRHTDDVVADHRISPVDRDHQFIHAHAIRNRLTFVVQRVPLFVLPARFAGHLVSHVAYCASRGWWRALACGLGGFVRRLPWALAHRRPVTMRTWRRYVCLSGPPRPAPGAEIVAAPTSGASRSAPA